ncbi:MAG: cellulase family glycosylhydrolase [Candidatus Pacebacteria bacterium]|nr:cellulase family glycosylhydrolase [Candidatus Paceibacterota bacterium]MDD3919251.1 cellulase family glycosylhydrolase [Candidatus Paceibacterota bacterium]
MNKFLWMITILLIIIISLFLLFLLTGKKAQAENIVWGVNFSSKQATDLGLDPKETYLKILDDLKADHIKLAVHWDSIEKVEDSFDMTEFDFYMNEAQKRGVKIILAIGMKTPRWPEYHTPEWTEEMSPEDQQKEILEMLSFVVNRYKDYSNLIAWQVENEPFFNYGKAPWKDGSFLEKEINIVKEADQSHEVVITDSGEMSFWFKAAKLGDVVGVTMYTKVWSDIIKSDFYYPYSPSFYGKKADLIKLFFKKEVWCLELQAEPWGKELIQDSTVEEQLESMSINRFKYNLEYAKKTGLNTFYFWGAEWWYYMQEKYNDSSFLDEAKNLWN